MSRRNIEMKARLHDLEKARRACTQLGARSQGEIRQSDTYFRVPEGRLKLRASDPGDDYLVFYSRPDIAGVKGCDYRIEPAARSLTGILGDALGVLAVVDKVRDLYLWKNVRIHLDQVEGLGQFVEFEAVLSEDDSDADGYEQIAYLRKVFGVADADMEAVSYLDLILANVAQRR